MGYRNLELHVRLFVTTMLVFTGTFSVGETDQLDGIVLLLFSNLHSICCALFCSVGRVFRFPGGANERCEAFNCCLCKVLAVT
ncbi:hypothetical protein L6164_036594 [Bauhinia variegata]|uniref:Uncharacterized protein n=1 Tax=Bauhinia variegata TaxID=167791 RepID=A0ACB9KHN2_BAUVA|nr:hypothetical protein L6164_036594 [Bauhinia variegata]